MSGERARTIGRFLFVAAFLLVAVPLGRLAGPGIEARLFPIITSVSRGTATIEDGHVCWDTAMHKRREAVPAYALYTATSGGLPVSISVYLERGGTLLTQPAFQNHTAGSDWITRYCTDLPRPLVGRSVLVEGVLYYDVWHGLWRVPQLLPAFVIGDALALRGRG